MSKRLQVLLPEDEFEHIRMVAAREGLTVSEWVRQVLRRGHREHPSGDQARKLAAVRAAARHAFPTADVGEMLEQIERGYNGR